MDGNYEPNAIDFGSWFCSIFFQTTEHHSVIEVDSTVSMFEARSNNLFEGNLEVDKSRQSGDSGIEV